jgi:hypothetical protein
LDSKVMIVVHPFIVKVQESLEILPRDIWKGNKVVPIFLSGGFKQSAEHRGFFHQEMAVDLEATILDEERDHCAIKIVSVMISRMPTMRFAMGRRGGA